MVGGPAGWVRAGEDASFVFCFVLAGGHGRRCLLGWPARGGSWGARKPKHWQLMHLPCQLIPQESEGQSDSSSYKAPPPTQRKRKERKTHTSPLDVAIISKISHFQAFGCLVSCFGSLWGDFMSTQNVFHDYVKSIHEGRRSPNKTEIADFRVGLFQLYWPLSPEVLDNHIRGNGLIENCFWLFIFFHCLPYQNLLSPISSPSPSFSNNPPPPLSPPSIPLPSPILLPIHFMPSCGSNKLTMIHF